MTTGLAAVVFDFDGVLADSEPLHLETFRVALGPRGHDLTTADYYAHFIGFNDEDALRAMAEHYAWTLDADAVTAVVDQKLRHMARLLAAPGVLYPDAAAFVTSLGRAVPLAIASGAKRHEIELVLGANGLADCFRTIVASGETPRSKPAPDPYARAVVVLQEQGVLERDDTIARRCVAIEDSRWGIVSARDAGLRCVAVTTSFAAEELRDADLVVERLADLSVERLSALVERRS